MRHNRRLGYLIVAGIRSIFTHGFMSFATVTVIIACLIIMGSFTLLAINVSAIIRDYEQQNAILAFVEDTYTEEQAKDIQPRLEALSNVREVNFVSRDEAMNSFVEKYDDQSMFSDIDPTVFRDRYVIYLDDISLMRETKEAVEGIRGIAYVNAHLEMSQGFITVRNVVAVISMILIVILLIVSVFIMANTIKLATYGRKEEIAIMKMVGASNFFIRCPFVVEGLILGVVGAGLAFLIQWGIYSLVSARVMTGTISNLVTILPFSQLQMPMLVVFLAVGLVVGIFGSNIAIRNYLKV